MTIGLISFFKVDRDYLTSKRVQWYFLTDLILGALALGAAMELYGTKWGLMLTVVSIVCLVDCVVMRYAYEIKRTIKGS